MTVQTADIQPVFEEIYDAYNSVGVVANTVIYKGMAVGDDGNGYGRPLVAGDRFLGWADCKADNSTGSAGNIDVTLRAEGGILLNIAGVTGIGDKGKAVYASDASTFTLTEGSNSAIGRIIRFHSGTYAVVKFDAFRGGIGFEPPITDNSGGTASNTLALIAAGTPADLATQGGINGVIANAIASLAARMNSLENRVK